jgi:type IV pilus assembly protein PilV
MHVAEVESYQRAQATILLRYMTDRINANRKNAMSYVTADSGIGSNTGMQDCSGLTGPNLDLCEWRNMLAGAAEAQAAQTQGAMIGARGCVFNIQPTMPRIFTVAVVWQGLSSTVAPGSTTCGNGAFADDRTRRAVVAPLTIGCLQNDPNTGLCVTP